MIEATIGTMTMGAGKGIFQSPIRWILKTRLNNFKKVIVFDGALDEESEEFYKTLENVEVVDMPWDDKYVARYRAFADRLENDEWGLWLDDDEIPSAELVERLKTLDPEDKNMFLLPCVLHISSTGKDYYPVEPTPPKEYVNGMWTKQILFKKTPTLSFRFFGSHVIPEQSNKGYLAEPYYHLKTVESFVRNDVLQAFVHPEGQRYTPWKRRNLGF